MAARPSGLRQPSAIRASNSNIASSSSGGAGSGPPTDVTAATPAAKTAAGSGALSMSRLPSSSSIRRKIATPAGIGINPPGSRDSGLATDIDSFIIGDTVYVNGDTNKRGKICFIGEVGFAKGDFAGIALDLPMGNHDGVVQGRRYFQCAPNHGLFTKLTRLSRDPILESPSTPRAPESVTGSTVASPAPQLSRAASVIAERTPSPGGMRTPMRTPGGSSLQLGERVIVASATGGTKIGILRYLGETDFAAGEWAGVELLTPMGKNNGSVGGRSYFTCKDKHGLFVPASKVISSPVNKSVRRHGSRESLISVSSLASSATSRSIRRPSTRDSQCLPTCSLQAVLSEKEKHMERLIKERELDRVDLANLSREFEEKKLEVKRLQLENAGYQQQIQSSSGDSEAVTRLQNALEEEHRKLEDLQYTLDEEKIMKADLQAQLDGILAKTSDEAVKSSEKSQAESEEHAKELESLKSQLAAVQGEAKSAEAKFQEAQLKINSLEKTISELNETVKTLNEKIDSGKEEQVKLLADRQAEVASLKKTITEKEDTVDSLNQKLNDKKRREEELKEKCEKLQVEYETTLKQKTTLEAEVIDLVNSKTDTSDILTGKIKDLSEELQELRAKLQSTEEDKAVLRRINAEFKSRISQNEQTEATLKKKIEEASSQLTEEKAAIEKHLTEKVSTIEAEKQKLSEELKSKEDEITSLKNKITEAEAKNADASSSSQELLKQIETLRSDVAVSGKKIEELQQLLKKAEDEKGSILTEKESREKDLNEKIKALSEKVEVLSGQLTSTTTESTSLKTEIEAFKTEIAKAKQLCDEKTSALKTLEEEFSNLTKKSEDDGFAIDELTLEVDKLKKDKSALKEQLAAFKTESSRFQEIEKGLSQEVVSLRSKLDQKNKMVSELEKELLEKKADIESSKAQTLDANSPQAHIDFLNSIIVDLQRKNEELNVKLNVLINGGIDADANSNRVPGGGDSSAPRPYQSLRPYCDICEKFDLHDTEDCPQQVSEDNNTHYGGNRGGESRPYCETCEIFGHATGECDDQETY